MSMQSKVLKVERASDLWGGTKKGPARPNLKDHPLVMKKWVAYQPSSWTEVEDIIALLNDPDDPYNIYKSVVIDSLTELNYVNLKHVVSLAVKRKPRDEGLDEVPEIGDYGVSSHMIRKLMRTFRDLPIHSFYTSLAQEVQDEVTKSFEVTPAMVGKLAGEIPGLVDIVGYIFAKRKGSEMSGRFMQCQPDWKVRAKDRSEGGKLGQIIELEEGANNLTRVLDTLGISVNK